MESLLEVSKFLIVLIAVGLSQLLLLLISLLITGDDSQWIDRPAFIGFVGALTLIITCALFALGIIP